MIHIETIFRLAQPIGTRQSYVQSASRIHSFDLNYGLGFITHKLGLKENIDFSFWSFLLDTEEKRNFESVKAAAFHCSNYYLKIMIKALSFSGAGFCGVYHLGATHALSKRLNFDDLQFCGASAGSIAAVSAAVWHGKNLEHQFGILKGLQTACKNHLFRNRMQEAFLDLFDKAYPEDILEYTNQRCFISLSGMFHCI